MDDSQFSLTQNCSNLTTEELISINLVFSISGAACCFVSLVITLLLLFCNACDTLLKRQFLYLMAATTLRELFLSASIEHHFQYSGQETVCIWIAYLYNWTGIVLSVYTIGMMVYLFYLVHCLAKGNTVSPPRFLQSKRYRIVMEIAYVLLPLLLSFAYASVPYFNHNYGLASAWCWIRNTDKDCKLTLSGLLDQLLNGYIFYETGGIAGIIFTIAIVIVYWRLPSTLYEARLLLKKTFFVLLCLLLSILIVMVAFINGMHVARTGQYQHLPAWLTIASLYPISLLLFPFGFLVCFYSGKMFNSSTLKRAITRRFCCCTSCKCKQNRRRVRIQAQFVESTQAPTIPASTRVTQPSNTFFKVPYTNEFTIISSQSEATVPLVSGQPTDTGYDSVSHTTMT